MLPNKSEIDRPQAIVLSGRKWPPSRKVSMPIRHALTPVAASAKSSPNHGEAPCVVVSQALA